MCVCAPICIYFFGTFFPLCSDRLKPTGTHQIPCLLCPNPSKTTKKQTQVFCSPYKGSTHPSPCSFVWSLRHQIASPDEIYIYIYIMLNKRRRKTVRRSPLRSVPKFRSRIQGASPRRGRGPWNPRAPGPNTPGCRTSTRAAGSAGWVAWVWPLESRLGFSRRGGGGLGGEPPNLRVFFWGEVEVGTKRNTQKGTPKKENRRLLLKKGHQKGQLLSTASVGG